jgi:ribosomal protein L11
MTSNTPSNPPSSRPMTLRQQLATDLANYYWAEEKYHAGATIEECLEQANSDLEALCQEIAREAKEEAKQELRDKFFIDADKTYDVKASPTVVVLTQKPPQHLADMQSDTSPKADSNQVDNSEEE